MTSYSSVPADALAELEPTSSNDGGSSTLSRRSTVLVAALAGAAAVTTGLAVPAQAAPGGKVWNRVANCESSQNWHINTGNGFYGGLQFSASTWGGFGGHKYAPQANHATRAEQIAVARRVLAKQGPDAWPVCGPRGGLTRHSGHATSATLPAHPGHSSASSKHHRKVHTAARTSNSNHHTYTVHSGDTLATIAHRTHVHGGWHALYKANKSTISNPNVIHVGQVLRLP